MSLFQNFEHEFGGATDCRPLSAAEIAALAPRLPAPLVARWRDVGLCAHGGGLLRFVHPDGFTDVLQEWLEPTPQAAATFLRTAFGDLYFWAEGSIQALDVHYGRVSQITDDLDLFFDDVLCDQRVQTRSLRRPLFDQVVN